MLFFSGFIRVVMHCASCPCQPSLNLFFPASHVCFHVFFHACTWSLCVSWARKVPGRQSSGLAFSPTEITPCLNGPLDLLFCTGKAQLFTHCVFNQWLIRLSRLPSLVEPIECLGCWAIKPLHSAVDGTRLSAQLNVERREVKFYHFSKILSMRVCT